MNRIKSGVEGGEQSRVHDTEKEINTQNSHQLLNKEG